jgi:hypothetical protein
MLPFAERMLAVMPHQQIDPFAEQRLERGSVSAASTLSPRLASGLK